MLSPDHAACILTERETGYPDTRTVGNVAACAAGVSAAFIQWTSLETGRPASRTSRPTSTFPRLRQLRSEWKDSVKNSRRPGAWLRFLLRVAIT